eukprot:TRINITY_DN796_c0_g1_i2.p1 TRINITY_DN796_c0_g1~~TRINITY_DN796_c0_g1_i2.p1  ORF type:complete len:205 (+),score=80.21 TRINITY_DN796_c0_g1_i2:256-870(+)
MSRKDSDERKGISNRMNGFKGSVLDSPSATLHHNHYAASPSTPGRKKRKRSGSVGESDNGEETQPPKTESKEDGLEEVEEGEEDDHNDDDDDDESEEANISIEGEDYEEGKQDDDEELEKEKRGRAFKGDKRGLSFRDAAFVVLQRTGRAMSVEEITKICLKEGLVSTLGKTPQNTLASMLYSDVARPSSRFVKVAAMTFALKS